MPARPVILAPVDYQHLRRHALLLHDLAGGNGRWQAVVDLLLSCQAGGQKQRKDDKEEAH
jgi:hypothetical protein